MSELNMNNKITVVFIVIFFISNFISIKENTSDLFCDKNYPEQMCYIQTDFVPFNNFTDYCCFMGIYDIVGFGIKSFSPMLPLKLFDHYLYYFIIHTKKYPTQLLFIEIIKEWVEVSEEMIDHVIIIIDLILEIMSACCTAFLDAFFANLNHHNRWNYNYTFTVTPEFKEKQIILENDMLAIGCIMLLFITVITVLICKTICQTNHGQFINPNMKLGR